MEILTADLSSNVMESPREGSVARQRVNPTAVSPG